MSKALEWDNVGERFYETGVDKGVLYLLDETKKYSKGVAWNGIKSVNESRTGGEETPLYADNIKYASLYSVEKYGATLAAYMYPDEFAECDGSAELTEGVYLGQQARRTFGLCYRTLVGNDTPTEADDSYKLHLVYGCMAAPSEKNHETVNESPAAMDMSWTITTVPVKVAGFKPTSAIEIDSRKVKPESMKKLEDILYGSETADARLPMPDEIKQILTAV